jgi:hypothetical protein
LDGLGRQRPNVRLGYHAKRHTRDRGAIIQAQDERGGRCLGGGRLEYRQSDYDEATETWRFGMLQFSENYYDFLEHLPLFRAVDRFKDRPGVDFLLVYNFLISPDDYVVFFEMTEGRSVIAGSPGQGVNFPNAYAEEAATFLTSLIPAG